MCISFEEGYYIGDSEDEVGSSEITRSAHACAILLGNRSGRA